MNLLFRGLLDLIYPPRCQVCRRFDPRPFCQSCWESIELIQPPVCRQCGAPLDPSATGPQECNDCRARQKSAIAWARSAGLYDGTLQRAILNLKYTGCRALAIPLAGLLVEAVRNLEDGQDSFDAVCPVPLHPQRQKERGFNQSELLAKYLCETAGLKMDKTIIQRIRPTLPQVMLPPKERGRNVRGAFALAPAADVAAKRILLIDDIHTTGSTLQECARVLQKGGAAAVCVLTLARPKPAWMAK